LFKRILIVNRGEIAVRIIRACKELGIISAAVYSEADKTQLHIRLADEAYLLGAAPSSESYLSVPKIIRLAEEIKADAIHPGYGFLSENAAFIKAVEDHGIIFIGPSSASVKLMGSKTEARKTMIKNGVPVVPGTTDAIKNIAGGLASAKEIGYPVLLKASAGGGGKGMRKVEKESEFENSFFSAQREALKAFGNDAVYIEKYIENPRHIEVQIIGDKHGTYTHIFERECSIQRRHQKIVEEAPSQFVDEETRRKITAAAIKAAESCKYVNAGTVEFLMDREKNFYFLEMNTRVQVEHPVTELISGIDIVKEQISIAAGNKLSFNSENIKINGYAIECRLYAEDPDNNFLPSTGTIKHFRYPSGPGVRMDSGYEKGTEVSVYYDPLLAKIICWGPDKNEALKKMSRALDETEVSGIITNKTFLKEICTHKNFINGNYNINWLEREFKTENKPLKNTDAAAVFAVLMKQRSLRVDHPGAAESSNKWTGLLYE
jgi:acetyl-CoA carboxylase, biotin carboxylase subunit